MYVTLSCLAINRLRTSCLTFSYHAARELQKLYGFWFWSTILLKLFFTLNVVPQVLLFYCIKYTNLNDSPFMFSGCRHQLCVRCALYLCSTSNIPSLLQGPPGSIPCPLCRHGIVSFAKLPGSPTKEVKLSLSLSLCTPCMLHSRDSDRSTPDIRKNRVASVSPDIFCPVTCSPFPSVIPMCACSDGPCPTCGPHEVEAREGSPHQSQSTTVDQDKMERVRLEKTSCSSMFWSRRSCSREHQCNSEINA